MADFIREEDTWDVRWVVTEVNPARIDVVLSDTRSWATLSSQKREIDAEVRGLPPQALAPSALRRFLHTIFAHVDSFTQF